MTTKELRSRARVSKFLGMPKKERDAQISKYMKLSKKDLAIMLTDSNWCFKLLQAAYKNQ